MKIFYSRFGNFFFLIQVIALFCYITYINHLIILNNLCAVYTTVVDFNSVQMPKILSYYILSLHVIYNSYIK